MKNQKLNKRILRLAGAGLFILTFPFLSREFIKLNDFCSGFLHGLGITLIFGALFIDRKNKRNVYNINC